MNSQLKWISMSEYLANPAYGASDFVKMAQSFAYWKYKKANPDPAGRPLVIGQATHVLLESEIMNKPYYKRIVQVYNDGSSLTKGFKAFSADNKNSICVDLEERALVDRMVRAILEDKDAMSYLDGAEAEATVFGHYPGTAVACKVRPDYLHVGRGVSINLKTANDASESGFINGCREFGYDFQSALYCDILSNELERSFDEVHIVVEKGDSIEECQVNLFTFGEDTLCHARTMLQQLMERISECEKTGIWPKKQTILQTVELPFYARKVVNP